MTLRTPTVFAEQIASPRLLVIRLISGVYRYADLVDLEKRCSKCREYFPADNTFFYAAPRSKDGLIDWCKACYLESRAERAKRSGQERLAA